MPFTPFHFGPGALVYSAAPKHISFLAFCGANVLVDVEPLYFMVTHQWPIHRFFHTYAGATVAAAIVVGLFVLVRKVTPRLIEEFKLQKLSARAVQRCESVAGRGFPQHAARVLRASWSGGCSRNRRALLATQSAVSPMR